LFVCILYDPGKAGSKISKKQQKTPENVLYYKKNKKPIIVNRFSTIFRLRAEKP